MDYRRAGVDLAAAERLVDAIAPAVTSTWGAEVVGTFGSFAAGLRLPDDVRRPLLMMTADGVGTKAELARLAHRFEGLGSDLVAMLVDDLAATGARALGLVDYLAVGRLDEDRDQGLIEGVAAACRQAGCVLLGGETAEHPGVMQPDRIDLSGAAMGVVEEGTVMTGDAIRPGDRLVGVESPNLRCNGFSLIRQAVLPRLPLHTRFPGRSETVAEVFLEPSVIYAPAVLAVLEKRSVHGLAHITGGGLPGNLSRILPTGCRALVRLRSWEPPSIFGMVAQVGSIPDREMYRTFNMGMGFVAVAAPDGAGGVIDAFAAHGHAAREIGEVEEGKSGVDLLG